MKQTQSAIRFLMAQYRAIFKQAYLKGLVSAAVVTAGLAMAGAANADTLTDNNWDTLVKNDVSVGNSTNDYVNVSGSKTSYTLDTTLTIVGGHMGSESAVGTGDQDYNYITSSGADISITGDGKLVIDTTTSTDNNELALGLALFAVNDTGKSGSLTVNLDQGIDINTGYLHLLTSGAGSAIKIENDINVGDGVGSSEDNKRGLLFLGSSGSNVDSSGTITLGKASDSTTAGTNFIVKSDGVVHAYSTINVEAETFNVDEGGLIRVLKSNTSVPNLTIKSHNADIAGGLDIRSGTAVNVTLSNHAVNDEGLEITGTEQGVLTLRNTSETKLAGTLTINQGKVVLEENASLYAHKRDDNVTGSAKIEVKGTGTDKTATLALSSKQLVGFLNGYGLDLESTKVVSGGVFVSGSNSTLNFTDEGVVDLYALTQNSGAIKFDSGSSASANTVSVSGGYIFSKNLAISDSDASKLNLNDASLKAETLTLGSKNYNKTGTLNFKDATAKNVVFSATNTFTLADTLTLRSTRSITDGSGNPVIVGESGSITGPVIIGNDGSITVDGGIYEANSITMASGELTVKNDAGANASSLTVDTLSFSGTTGNTVIVSGDASVNDSVLTINDIKLPATDISGSITAQTDGVINIKGTDVQDLLDLAASKKNSDLNKIVTLNVAGGTVNVDGNITLKYTSDNFKNLNSALQVTSGRLNADTLTFDVSGSTVNELKFGGTVAVNELVGNIKNDSGKYESSVYPIIGEGTYIINSRLASQNDKAQIAQANGVTNRVTVNLGENKTVTEGTHTYQVASTQGGTVDVKTLEIGESGSLVVNAGAWTGKAINLSNATAEMTVGQSGAQDINDNDITASFTGTKFTSTAGTLNVNSNGTATFGGFDNSSGGSTVVSGALNINGGTVSSEDKTNEVKLAANSITVNSAGTLTFGAGALTNSIMSGSVINTTNVAVNAIKAESNSTVKLDFQSGSFTIAELTQLKKDLFADDVDGQIAGVLNIGKAGIGGLDIENGSISWDNYKPVSDVASDVTTDALSQAKVTGVDSAFKGHVGSVESDTTHLDVNGNTSFSNAAGNNGFFASYNGQAADIITSSGSDVSLNNGGVAGNINLNSSTDDGAVLYTNGSGNTTIASVNGDADSTFENHGKNTTVTGNVTIGELDVMSDTVLTIEGKLDVDNTGHTTDLDGKTTVKGAATIQGRLAINGETKFESSLDVKDETEVNGNTYVAGTATLNADAEVANAALFKTKSVELKTNSNGAKTVLAVGTDSYTENGETKSGSTGYLETDSAALNGNTLIVDPAYGQKTSIAAIKHFTDTSSNVEDAGVVNGDVIVGQNAGLMAGSDASIANMQAFLTQFQDANGSLKEKEIGAIVYLNDKLTLNDGSQLIIDSTRTHNEILGASGSLNDGKTYHATYTDSTGSNTKEADLYIGANSALAVGDNIIEQGAAIHFDKTDAYVMGGDKTSKIILVGDKFLNSSTIHLFSDKGTNTPNVDDTGVKIIGNDIRVESLNGLMYFDLKANTEVTGGTLELDTSKVDQAYLGASAPMRDFLIAYASKTDNWDAYYNQSTQSGQPGYIEREYLIDGIADKSLYTADANGDITGVSAKGENLGLTIDDFHAELDSTTGKYTVYRIAHNKFLERVVRDTNGAAADQASRMGVFGGAAQAANAAAKSSYESISGRFGMGSASSMSLAENGQGAGLWVTPIYSSMDSDGFSAQGQSYGADVDLFGVALGGDYTMSNGLRFGAMFNVGSGDADGNGLGAGVSNDFSYYGFGLYAGFSYEQFSVIGDVGYSVVDNDVEANTAAGKVKSSFDTAALTFGVTGQYKLSYNSLDIIPHAGLRFTQIDMDDYSFESESYGHVGSFDSDEANIFSVPVGVTFASEFQGGNWTVKPSFDITLTANMGDDEIDGVTKWDGVARTVSTTSEFMDNFTYGATLGVAAQTGNFSLGLGVNYTGSSNTDEYGVNANARFVF